MLELDVDQLSLFSLLRRNNCGFTQWRQHANQHKSNGMIRGGYQQLEQHNTRQEILFCTLHNAAKPRLVSTGGDPTQLAGDRQGDKFQAEERDRAPRLQRSKTTHRSQGRSQKQTTQAEDVNTKEDRQRRQRARSTRTSEQGTVRWFPPEPPGKYMSTREPWTPTYQALASSPRKTL